MGKGGSEAREEGYDQPGTGSLGEQTLVVQGVHLLQLTLQSVQTDSGRRISVLAQPAHRLLPRS